MSAEQPSAKAEFSINKIMRFSGLTAGKAWLCYGNTWYPHATGTDPWSCSVRLADPVH
jgi:hypothetical protein